MLLMLRLSMTCAEWFMVRTRRLAAHPSCHSVTVGIGAPSVARCAVMHSLKWLWSQGCRYICLLRFQASTSHGSRPFQFWRHWLVYWLPTSAGVYSSNGDLLTSESFQCITFTVGNPSTLAVFRRFQQAWIPAVSILFGILAITYDSFLRMQAVIALG